MLDDMTIRGLHEDTQCNYDAFVLSFAAFLGRSPENETLEDVRHLQVYQAGSRMHLPTINNSVSALCSLFSITLDRTNLSRRLV